MLLLCLGADSVLANKEAGETSETGITSRLKETVTAIKYKNNNVLEFC